MSSIRSFLAGYKSYLLAGSAVLTALAAYASGDLELIPMLAIVWGGAFGIALRAAVSRLFTKIGG